MKEKFLQWLDGDLDVMDSFAEAAEEHDAPREAVRARRKALKAEVDRQESTRSLTENGRVYFEKLYRVVTIASCIVLIGVLLFTVAHLPYFGQENPRAMEVVRRYVEKGLEETGAVNIVAGMILDYRAFDTLGESHVLFTALICVMVLLRRDNKNMASGFEDYYRVIRERYYAITEDEILKRVGMVLIPTIFLYGIYILLNGQNSPGGGFSGGAILGAGMIIFSASYGFETADRFFTRRLFSFVTLAALSFYSFAKGYVFLTGANGIPNGIPKGTPGAILSGGLIMPLDIAVGIVVACTMFGLYSLFRRGSIGGEADR